MTNEPATGSAKSQSTQPRRDLEDLIRQLEQFPIEALEAALIMLPDRKQRQPG